MNSFLFAVHVKQNLTNSRTGHFGISKGSLENSPICFPVIGNAPRVLLRAIFDVNQDLIICMSSRLLFSPCLMLTPLFPRRRESKHTSELLVTEKKLLSRAMLPQKHSVKSPMPPPNIVTEMYVSSVCETGFQTFLLLW
ncbi:hypothetical protein AMECASPLE_029333 [Ameca splendens]|uniref:Uncharacterized protein n=1 Tax=Ameca splendens TaxID=208324 RepID=A0ABV0Z467_9TELE